METPTSEKASAADTTVIKVYAAAGRLIASFQRPADIEALSREKSIKLLPGSLNTIFTLGQLQYILL